MGEEDNFWYNSSNRPAGPGARNRDSDIWTNV